MTKVMNSLITKLIISFVLLIVIIAGGTFVFTFNSTKKALLDSTRDDVLQIVGMSSTQFTPQEVDAMKGLKPGDETPPGSPEYQTLKKKMQDMRALSPNIINYYTMWIDGDKVYFYIDDLTEDYATVGQQYEQPEQKLYDAVNGPQVSDDVYTDEWGTFLSGYAPLKDSNGNPTVILGADMEATKVIERQNFIGSTIYYIMGIGILIAAIIIGVFSVTIIKDIKKLNGTANKISMGDTNVNVDVKRSDEIGELAESFGRMVASLKIMMVTDQPKEEEKKAEPEKTKKELKKK
jgi:methyl-accepting chemotaxis protein